MLQWRGLLLNFLACVHLLMLELRTFITVTFHIFIPYPFSILPIVLAHMFVCLLVCLFVRLPASLHHSFLPCYFLPYLLVCFLSSSFFESISSHISIPSIPPFFSSHQKLPYKLWASIALMPLSGLQRNLGPLLRQK